MEDNLNVVQQAQATTDRKGLAISSLVLGIVSVVGIIIPKLNSFVWICAILGLIFGILGLKSSKKGMSIAGLVLSCVGLFIYLLVIIIAVIFVSSVMNGNFGF